METNIRVCPLVSVEEREENIESGGEEMEENETEEWEFKKIKRGPVRKLYLVGLRVNIIKKHGKK